MPRNRESWTGECLANLESAGVTPGHVAFGGAGNYMVVSNSEDNSILAKYGNRKWLKLPLPPLEGGSISQLAIRSSSIDFKRRGIEPDALVEPFDVVIVTSDGRLLYTAMATDTRLNLCPWQEMVLGDQSIPLTEKNRLRVSCVSLGSSNRSREDEHGDTVVGFITTDGYPGACCPCQVPNVHEGEPYYVARVFWKDVQAVKVVCGDGLIAGLTANGSVWRTVGSSLKNFAGMKILMENVSSESDLVVLDIDAFAHARDIAAVTQNGTVHVWTADDSATGGPLQIATARAALELCPNSPNVSRCLYDAVARAGRGLWCGAPNLAGEKKKLPTEKPISFDTARKILPPLGETDKFVRVALGGREMVVALATSGDVY
eukprot:2248558-Prymnesium_polylepis.1